MTLVRYVAILCPAAVLAVTLCASAQPALPGAARVAAAVVYVELAAPVAGLSGPQQTGTGFVIASNKSASYIATAAHVLSCDTYGNWCRPALNLRLPGASAADASGELVYAGAANDSDDVAIVRVARGGLAPVTLGTAQAGERIGALGYPGGAAAQPRLRDGSVVRRLPNSDELAMRVDTTQGDSGGPIFDATSGAVVGIVHGTLGGGAPDERSAIAVGELQTTIAAATSAAAGHDAQLHARLIYDYAAATLARCEALRPVTAGIEVDQQCSHGRELLVAALNAGSLDAAISLAETEYKVLTSLPNRAAALAMLDAAGARGNYAASYAAMSYYRFAYQAAKTDADHATASAALWREVTRAAGNGDGISMALLGMFYQYAAQGKAKDGATSIFSAFDPSWDLGASKDAAAATDWARRAAGPLADRIANGDASAAYISALQFQLSPAGQDFSNVGVVAERFLRAVALGSDSALQAVANYSGLTGTAQADVFRALKTAYDHGKTGDFATALGLMYATGEGTPVDKHAALLAYRSAGFNPLSVGVRESAAGGDEIAATLAASPGYAAALTSSVRMSVADPVRGFPNTVPGTVVQADGGGVIIATAAFALGCDAWAKGCRKPAAVTFANGRRADGDAISLIRSGVAELSDGIALLRVAGVTAPAAAIDDTVPDVVVSACIQATWGIVLSAPGVRDILDLAVPFPTEPGTIGCGLFDLRTGRLAGVYTDPEHIYGAGGPATIAQALHEVR